ncbi:MAG TPA: PilZ domain-containing protein [Tepidisphaeraceae bacterium]|nr:PilZ domain-containing protein [Tepidisphaeraceae bacterium]
MQHATATAESLSSTTAGTAERRRSSREERNLPAWLSSAVGSRSDAGFNVTILDLSMHGAGFAVAQPLNPGDAHWLVVSGASLRLSTRLHVVSCRPNPSGEGYICGAEFF